MVPDKRFYRYDVKIKNLLVMLWWPTHVLNSWENEFEMKCFYILTYKKMYKEFNKKEEALQLLRRLEDLKNLAYWKYGRDTKEDRETYLEIEEKISFLTENLDSAKSDQDFEKIITEAIENLEDFNYLTNY